jgi:hypothetical protein
MKIRYDHTALCWYLAFGIKKADTDSALSVHGWFGVRPVYFSTVCVNPVGDRSEPIIVKFVVRPALYLGLDLAYPFRTAVIGCSHHGLGSAGKTSAACFASDDISNESFLPHSFAEKRPSTYVSMTLFNFPILSITFLVTLL